MVFGRKLAATLALLLIAQLAVATDKIGAPVRSALRDESTVRVLVFFDTGSKAAGDAALKRAVRSRASRILDRLASQRTTLHHRFLRVPALALQIDAAALRTLEAMPEVRRIDLDVGGHGAMNQARPIVRVNETFSAGLTGAGAKIAVIDSGIDTDHPDFSGRIVAQQCFCSGFDGAAGCCPNGDDTMGGAGSAEDDLGHGTNVAGIAAGGGAVAARGAAPAASIVAVKVLDDGNSFCCISDVVAALDWVRQNHPDTAAVNASLGTSMLFTGECDADTSYTQALATAIDNLRANGTMTFVASGNQGSATALSAPACTSNAFAVGATWDNNLGIRTAHGCTTPTAVDRATCFSNSNAQVALYAPGAEVTSSHLGGGAATYVGTSQAAPLVAGCATALRAEFPTATPALLRSALRASPTTIVDAKNGLAFPRLDCADAALRASDAGAIFFDGFEH